MMFFTYIPGFRSGKLIKKIIASVYYVFSLPMLTVGIPYFLILLSLPFIFFHGINLFKRNRKTISIAILSISLLTLFISFSLIAKEKTEKILAETVVGTVEENDIKGDAYKDYPKAGIVIPADPSEGTDEKAEEIITKTDAVTTSEEDHKEYPEKDIDVREDSPGNTDKVNKKVTGNLTVHFLDVGQGDCILIQTSKDKTMLIDAGKNADRDFVLSYLEENGIEDIHVLVGTHPHEDHIGSLDDVIYNFNVGKIYMPDVTHTTETFMDVLDAIKSRGLKVTSPTAGEHIDFDENTRVQILAPNSETYGDLNDYSIVIRLEYGDTSFLFTGDAESVSEKEILSKGFHLESDVLKVGHHGSITSSTIPFINAVKPKYSVISVGKDNSYGHPDSIVVSRLERYGDILRTDVSGTIIVTTDGTHFTIEEKPSVKEIADAKTIYIGNKSSKIFHRQSCKTLLLPKNQIIFNSREEAIRAGYRPCKNCEP